MPELQAMRSVNLSIAPPPTLEEVIRATIGALDATGSSYTLSIPSNVQSGDLLLATFAYITTDANQDGNMTGYINTPSGWSLYPQTGAWTSEKLPEHYITESIHLYVFNKIASPGDAGSAVTFSYVTADSTTIDKVIFFLLVTNGTHVSDWQDNNVVYYDIEGYGSFEENFYFTSVETVKPYSLLYLPAVMKGSHAFASSYKEAMLSQMSLGAISFYVAVKMINTAGSTGNIYPSVDTVDYFGAITLSVEKS